LFARRKRLHISSTECSWRLYTMTLHADRASQLSILNRRINKVHPDEAVGTVEQPQQLLDDPVAAVVGQNKRDRQLLVSGRPQRLD